MRDWRIGERLNDGRWFAPAAERNREPILEVLRGELPQNGRVLEVASGTGQHVVHFARSLPHLSWQPSDPDPGFRRSIALWIEHEQLVNVRAPIALDVRQPPWPVGAADAVVCINMVHVAPWAATQALFEGVQQVLPREGLLFLYGPFRRAGRHTAPSNAKFDAELRARDPNGACATSKRWRLSAITPAWRSSTPSECRRTTSAWSSANAMRRRADARRSPTLIG